MSIGSLSKNDSAPCCLPFRARIALSATESPIARCERETASLQVPWTLLLRWRIREETHCAGGGSLGTIHSHRRLLGSRRLRRVLLRHPRRCRVHAAGPATRIDHERV